jgi:hypothetical protein
MARVAIVPYEPFHRAMLPVRREQADDLKRFHQGVSFAAERGPAFSAVEQDDEGRIVKVLACAGLAENGPDYATAWAAFADGLRPAEWSPVVHAIRGVIEGVHYSRIDTLVKADWPVARRFAEALGFREDCIMYSRAGGEAASGGS